MTIELLLHLTQMTVLKPVSCLLLFRIIFFSHKFPDYWYNFLVPETIF
jgi:hypothetical protein